MPSTTVIEQDHFPEIAENGGVHMLAQQLGLSELELSSTHERRSTLASMETADLVHAVVGLNALLRGKAAEAGKIEDGQIDEPTPPFEDKEPLLHEAVAAFKEILHDIELDDEAALHRAGLTLAGAISFIHAFDNGNGRTARSVHYLTEFGAQRGEALFEAEAYSLLGRLAVFNSDSRMSVDVTPPDLDMRNALNTYCRQNSPEIWESANERTKASMRVLAFLDAMTGRTTVLTTEETIAPRIETVDFGGRILYEKLPAGTDIVDLYERNYRAQSFAASVNPDIIPSDSIRAQAVRSANEKQLAVPVDIV